MTQAFSQLSKTIIIAIILSLGISISSFAESQPEQSIKLSVSLDPALQDELNPDATVFVYARAAKGPRMPLAIVSYKGKDLPLETQLDSSMAMMPQMSLNAFPQVVFLARVSASGQAISQPGDLIGETAPLEWQTLDKPVNIIINNKY